MFAKNSNIVEVTGKEVTIHWRRFAWRVALHLIVSGITMVLVIYVGGKLGMYATNIYMDVVFVTYPLLLIALWDAIWLAGDVSNRTRNN